jgi:hypothetical protein
MSEIQPELLHFGYYFRVGTRKMRYKRRKQDMTFYAHMKNLKSHDGCKIQEKFDTKGLICFHHPLYSPDLSPCDFCFFGMAKRKMRDREFDTFHDLFGRLTEI